MTDVNDVVIPAQNASGSQVTFNSPVATDVFGSSLQVNCAPSSGSQFPIGLTVVLCNATDPYGNTDSEEFLVNVTSPSSQPIISPVANVSVKSRGALTHVAYPLPTATDAFGDQIPIICNPSSNSSFSKGTTLVTCIAKDAYNNTASTSFYVLVSGQGLSLVFISVIVVFVAGCGILYYFSKRKPKPFNPGF
jgi:hypothetical protein